MNSATASTTPGDHPDILNSGVSATRGVNRYWTLTPIGLAFTNYNALFNFVFSDKFFQVFREHFVVELVTVW